MIRCSFFSIRRTHSTYSLETTRLARRHGKREKERKRHTSAHLWVLYDIQYSCGFRGSAVRDTEEEGPLAIMRRSAAFLLRQIRESVLAILSTTGTRAAAFAKEQGLITVASRRPAMLTIINCVQSASWHEANMADSSTNRYRDTSHLCRGKVTFAKTAFVDLERS